MLTKDYYFDLPEELIAQYPSKERGNDRLLLLDKNTGEYRDMQIGDLPSLIDPSTVVVVNNSKVRKARCFARSATGGIVEFLFLKEFDDGSWMAMVSKSKRQKVGKSYEFRDRDGNVAATCIIAGDLGDGNRRVVFDKRIGEDFFARVGHVPLPPYIKREDEFSDESRYQTVYAKKEGSVASPTAGLHFTPGLMDEVRRKGVPIYEVTLHVGLGTFLPVRSENIEDHHMHTEHFEISDEVFDALNRAKSEGRRILAIGTTSVRTLESAAGEDGFLEKKSGDTDIFIRPGYRFRFVDDLLTNFHTPESTLLMLVSALAGKDNIFCAYRHAVEQGYRFFSYGDAMLIKG